MLDHRRPTVMSAIIMDSLMRDKKEALVQQQKRDSKAKERLDKLYKKGKEKEKPPRSQQAAHHHQPHSKAAAAAAAQE